MTNSEIGRPDSTCAQARLVCAPAIAALVCCAWAVTVQAADPCTPALARVVSVQGSVELRRAGVDWKAAELNAPLCAGDTVRVLQRSRAALLLSNETTLRLDQGTTLTLAPPDGKGTTLLEQLRGGLHVITRTPKPFQVKTPFVNANVEGTEFSVRVVDDSTTIAVYEGRVLASNDIGSVSLGSGEEVSAAKGASPRKEIVVRPVDAVAWTLYFPTVFDYRLARAGADTGETLRRSVELYRAGLLGDALAASEAVPQDARSAGWLNYRAALLLQVGRLDAARPAIAEALRLEPANSDSRSLLAIVAVVENNKNGALEFAGQAVRDDLAALRALDK